MLVPVCVCGGRGGGGECVCVCVRALRIVSMDKILRFTNTLIIIIVTNCGLLTLVSRWAKHKRVI